MAQQNIYYTPHQQRSSSRANLQVDVPWRSSALRGGHSMQISNSTGSSSDAMTNYSDASSPGPSHSSPNTDYTAMSSYGNSPGPVLYENYDNNYTSTAHPSDNSNYGPCSTPTPSTTPRFGNNLQARNTPSSLGWLPETHFLKLYKFVICKAREDHHFELLAPYAATLQTPLRVYLDSARHVF